MAIGIAEMLRTQPPTAPHTLLREQFLRREEHFLHLAKQVVFAQPDHPYHRMFRHAGRSFGDLAQLVKSSGLEATLLQLRRAGVYLSHDEFKGKVPVVRGGESFSVRPASFANPLVKGWMQSSSSGSRGAPVRSAQSTFFKLHREAYSMLRIEEFGLAERAQVEVKAILPSTSGLNPAFEQIGMRRSHFDSNYHLLQLFLQRRWRQGLLSLRSGQPISPQVGFGRARLRPSSNDQGQRPDATGMPTAQIIQGGVQQYFNPLAFTLPAAGFLGNTGRNTLPGPGLAALDAALHKALWRTDRQTVTLRMEAFNVTNRPNFATPSNLDLFDSQLRRIDAAGRITATSTPSRQMQIAVRWTF